MSLLAKISHVCETIFIHLLAGWLVYVSAIKCHRHGSVRILGLWWHIQFRFHSTYESIINYYLIHDLVKVSPASNPKWWMNGDRESFQCKVVSRCQSFTRLQMQAKVAYQQILFNCEPYLIFVFHLWFSIIFFCSNGSCLKFSVIKMLRIKKKEKTNIFDVRKPI